MLLIMVLSQAIDHIINSAAKSNYMSAGQINVPIVFRGPNGAAAGVGAQHSQVPRTFELSNMIVGQGLNSLSLIFNILKSATKSFDDVLFGIIYSVMRHGMVHALG